MADAGTCHADGKGLSVIFTDVSCASAHRARRWASLDTVASVNRLLMCDSIEERDTQNSVLVLAELKRAA
jgi:hypothetical protein